MTENTKLRIQKLQGLGHFEDSSNVNPGHFKDERIQMAREMDWLKMEEQEEFESMQRDLEEKQKALRTQENAWSKIQEKNDQILNELLKIDQERNEFYSKNSDFIHQNVKAIYQSIQEDRGVRNLITRNNKEAFPSQIQLKQLS